MTAGQFRKVDLDLLADYVGGALEGTPEESTVARLVAEDPAWTRAHAALAPKMETVRHHLANWGATDLAMPADISARLSAALAGAGPAAADPADSSRADRRVADPYIPDQTRHRLSVVPDVGRTSGGRDGRAGSTRRRWSRWAGPLTVAAALVVVAGVGASQFSGIDRAQDSAGQALSGESNEPRTGTADSSAARAAAELSTRRVIASGTEYQRTTLAGALASLDRTAIGAKTPDGAPAAEPDSAISRVAGLHRLTDRGALAGCLDAVAATHNQGPVAVDLVDYAAFEGIPALVISFADQAGERWIWVAGPECGTPGSGADTRYRTRVG